MYIGGMSFVWNALVFDLVGRLLCYTVLVWHTVS